ncbi:MAG: oligosaccharide flippase family protein [Chloroflexota bacterium]
MNNPRLIFKNTLAQTAADLLNRFSQLLIVFVMARLLHASGIGLYATAMAYFALMDEATNMGATTYLIRQVANEPGQTSRYVVNFSLLGAGFALLGLGAFYALLPHLGYDPEMRQAIALVALAILPGTLNAVQYSVFVAHQRVEFVAYTGLAASLVTLGGSLYLLLSGRPVIAVIGVFVFVQYLVAGLYYFFINRRITRLTWRFEPRFALRLLWEIRVFAALSLLGGLMSQPEVILLSLLAAPEQVGYYSAAIKIAFVWLFISQIYMNNVYPVLSRSFHQADGQFQIIQDQAVRYLLALGLPLCAGMIAAAGPIIRLFYGPGFDAAVAPLQWLAMGLLPAYLGAVLWRSLAARGRQDAVLHTRLLALALRLAGGAALIAAWAERGAAISAALNLMFSLLLMAVFLWRAGIRIGVVALGWRFALAAALMGAAVWWGAAWLPLWLLVGLAAPLYLGLALALRAISPAELSSLRRLWSPA